LQVLGFPVASTGLASAAPYIVSFGLKLVAGMISDSMHCISERRRLQLFSCIAFGGMTALFLCLANIPPRQAGQYFYSFKYFSVMEQGVNSKKGARAD
jgi:hypothetical protein